jgi:hypothetical protein
MLVRQANVVGQAVVPLADATSQNHPCENRGIS